MPSIALSRIRLRHDARVVDEEIVAALADSMKAVGLLSPVVVRPVLDGDCDYELCAGSHRRAAAVKLGWGEIQTTIVGGDALHAELVAIDENLCRSELSPAERAHYTERRKAIYLEKHPETRERPH